MEKQAKPVFVSANPNMIVADLTKSIEFYTRALGFMQKMDGPNFAVLQRDQITLGLIVASDSKAAGHSWCYLTVTDVRAVFEEFKAAGARIAAPLQEWGEHVEFTIADLDGNTLDVGN
jgi:predicted enzyme related to lactoylglutathione lyase